jgi:hypothetical protein
VRSLPSRIRVFFSRTALNNPHCRVAKLTFRISRYTSVGLVQSWRVPPPAADAPASFATETWKVAEIVLGQLSRRFCLCNSFVLLCWLRRMPASCVLTIFSSSVDGGSFEVGAHQDCELRALATVERS